MQNADTRYTGKAARGPKGREEFLFKCFLPCQKMNFSSHPSPSKGFPSSSDVKASTCNAGDPGSIPGLGRSPGEGKGFPLQYSGLENPVDCIVHRVAKSRTQLSDFHVHVFLAEAADEAYRVTCSGHLSPKKQKKEWNLN